VPKTCEKETSEKGTQNAGLSPGTRGLVRLPRLSRHCTETLTELGPVLFRGDKVDTVSKPFPSAGEQRSLSTTNTGCTSRRNGSKGNAQGLCCVSGIFSPAQQRRASVYVLPDIHTGLLTHQMDICSMLLSTCQPGNFRCISSVSRVFSICRS
jgi:hypothetical protein